MFFVFYANNTGNDAQVEENMAYRKTDSSIQQLLPMLRQWLQSIQKAARRAEAVEHRTGAQQWLYDNAYLLEREGKGALQAIRRRLRNRLADGYQLYEAISSQLCRAQLPLERPRLSALLAGYGQRYPLDYGTLDFLPLALRCALLAVAAEGCGEAEPERGEALLSYSVQQLRQLNGLDWEALMQEHSITDRLLRTDPAGIYSDMDRVTRRLYCRAVYRKALAEGRTEREVAREALHLARQQSRLPENHVGYYLLPEEQPMRLVRQRLYFLLLTLPSALLAAMLCIAARHIWLWLPLLFLLWEPLQYMASSLALHGVEPEQLPRLEPKRLAERECTTAVVLSVLLSERLDPAALQQRLTELYYANPQEYLCFCVLADFPEADAAVQPADAALAERLCQAIEELCTRYGDRFCLFLRGRVYSATQRRYVGWERKRGAIVEFARYLKGEKTSAQVVCGCTARLPRVRYLLALDSDTRLLMDRAEQLVATAAHPLNWPVIDPKRGRVVAGYGALAPRMVTSLASARQTLFSRVTAGFCGVTAYDDRPRDLYQDLFGEGIFSGKGLLNLEAFCRLAAALPQGQILSHDILEGALLRTGVLPDVKLADSTPAGYPAWSARLSRWMRGDWQNLLFLFPRVRYGDCCWQNALSPLARFWLWDNLRRSLTPVWALVAAIGAIFLPKGAAAMLLAVSLFSLAGISLYSFARALFSRGGSLALRKYLSGAVAQPLAQLGQAVFQWIWLPQNALISLQAALLGLWRTFISRRHLLDWTTAAQTERGGQGAGAALRCCWVGELLAVALAVATPHLFWRIALALCCLLLPATALTARPCRARVPERLNDAQTQEVIGWAAAMFGWYEAYVRQEEHFLPPDNVQFSPVYAVAHRTSPTNIGMYLLSLLAAGDFGLLDEEGLLERLEHTVYTIERLENVRGNLYNWYDTRTLEPLSPRFVSSVDSANLLCALVALRQGLKEHSGQRPAQLALRVGRLVDRADLRLFFNPARGLFSIGYDPQKGVMCDSYYDFLMSEARAMSYFAVARRVVKREHWARLSRALARCGPYAGAASWTGTMFEYFMPHLLLPAPEGSLLDESLRCCLWAQRNRVRGRELPWGISESAYFAFDNQLNYQYKAHGVQCLGVKRGLDEELVIAPYASLLALPLAPRASVKNLLRMRHFGLWGDYGFYEAMDCTAGRMERNRPMVIYSYMAHHVGMGLVSAANCLFDGVMQRRFMRDPSMGAAAELLEETAAREDLLCDTATAATREREDAPPKGGAAQVDTVTPLCPESFAVSNGLLTSLYTDAGLSFLKTAQEDVTRRVTDPLRHPQGIFWLCHGEAGTFSATRAPFYEQGPSHYRFTAHPLFARYEAEAPGLRMQTDCTLLQNCPCERRELTVWNTSDRPQTVELLAYFEPILTDFASYSAHLAFAQLMLVLEYDPAHRCLLIHRRGRDGEPLLWLAFGLEGSEELIFEPRREQLLDCPFPQGIRGFYHRDFSCQAYCVDPVGAIRLQEQLPSGRSARHTLLLACARTRGAAVEALLQGRGSRQPCCTVFSALPEDRIIRQLLSPLLFGAWPAGYDPRAVAQNRLGQSGLWGMGISGDLPLVLLDFTQTPLPELFSLYLRAQQKLRTAMVPFDLAVLYSAEMHPALLSDLGNRLGQRGLSQLRGSRGGVFFVDVSTQNEETLHLLRAFACFIQGERLPVEPAREPFSPLPVYRAQAAPLPGDPALSVVGGAFADERFYVEQPRLAPFCQVLANGVFGTLVSHRYPGFSWAVNARENKLTPWSGDSAADLDGEQLLLRLGDRLYSLTDGARASFSAQDARYEGRCDMLDTLVRLTVAPSGFVKYLTVTLHNPTAQEVRCMCAYYIEPVLQVNRQAARFIQGNFSDGALHFYNPYNTAVPFHMSVYSDQAQVFPVFNRAAFWQGRWRQGEELPYHDPCGALIVPKILPPRSKAVLRYTLAAGASASAADLLARRPLIETAGVPNRIAIQTPDRSLDLLVNQFLPSQIRAARIQGRCGFYQCGGAYGFRDQLQDCGAYLLLEPSVARAQLLRCCAVQFPEGDVLHWWHPLPQNGGGLRGVRTRYSDDLLWLPFTLCDYLERTGEDALLSVQVPYLAGEPLTQGEMERYFAPGRSQERGSVYEHCRRAIEHALRCGPHGLALIGGGDWNDGYNQVGAQGQGESVWLSQFLALVLRRFAPLCERMGEPETARRYRAAAQELCGAIDRYGWDGAWYLRAFYDNGSAMGGKGAQECRIDLLPQAFAALCGMKDKQRVSLAVDSALRELVDEPGQIVRLFTPAFEKGEQQPGYVKGYPRGIRENGGQYTHGAIWLAWALFRLERPDEGYRLLRMLNPAARCADPELGAAYQREPYALAADVYTNPSRYGQGGWSLYTGAAGWFYRVVVQELLGVHLQGEKLTLTPRLPDSWPGAALRLELDGTLLEVTIRRCAPAGLFCDGQPCAFIPLDGKPHRVVYHLEASAE